MKVLVVLPRGLDVVEWRIKFERGDVPDQTPYGYHHAESLGCSLDFSVATSTPIGLLGIIDRGVRRLLGFDLRHLWNNRQKVFDKSYDVIWTHTEYEHLAITALSRLMHKHRAPLIAQSIWLMDDWKSYTLLKRWFYKWLMSQAEVATFHSPENMAMARSLRLSPRVELIYFGISLDSFPIKSPRIRSATGRPIRVLALGNDKHRDWVTFSQAFAGKANIEVRIGSSKFPEHLTSHNFTVWPMTQAEIQSAYDWADCVVVPLNINLHASGLTAVLESVAMGVPLVLTDAGGLREYFRNNHVTYVAEADAIALGEAVQKVVGNAELTYQKAVAAQHRFLDTDFTSRGFVERHVNLSRFLLGDI